MIKFFLPIIPPTITDQHNGIAVHKSKLRFYDTPDIANVKDLFISRLSQHKPTSPITGPVRLMTKWLFPVCSNHHNGEWKTTRPDTDNSIKLLKDCMTKTGFWKDDSQVASEITEKFFSDRPGIYIEIHRLVDDHHAGEARRDR